jgi:hypothetical protein
VLDGSRIVGWIEEPFVGGEDESSADTEPAEPDQVRDIMNQIDPGRLLTADTSARRALQLVAASDPFAPWFVLDGHEFVGTLDYDCFFKPPFKVCLFALVMQLEQRSLWLCNQDAEASWESLSEDRRESAIRMGNKRREDLPPSGLREEADEVLRGGPDAMLGYTMFCDKKTIICKRRLLPNISNSELQRVFDSMESLRNFCAHPDTYEEPFIEPQDLLEQITSCEKVLQAIEEQLLPPPPVEA